MLLSLIELGLRTSLLNQRVDFESRDPKTETRRTLLNAPTVYEQTCDPVSWKSILTGLTLSEAKLTKVISFLESLHRFGQNRYYKTPPSASLYWKNVCWSREAMLEDPVVGPFYRSQTSQLVRCIEQVRLMEGKCLDVACGTGFVTQVLADSTTNCEVDALDISHIALARLFERCRNARVRPLEMDFWDLVGTQTYRLITCADAIHHLGYVDEVIHRISHLMRADGFFIGNLWTADYFQEFQVLRYGVFGQLRRMLRFAYSAVANRTRNRVDTPYRTHLIYTSEIDSILNRYFKEICYLQHDRYFSVFSCRYPRYVECLDDSTT
jgi:SAM-dependent methyltransferase